MDICSFKNTFLTGDKGLASSLVFLSSRSSSAEDRNDTSVRLIPAEGQHPLFSVSKNVAVHHCLRPVRFCYRHLVGGQRRPPAPGRQFLGEWIVSLVLWLGK